MKERAGSPSRYRRRGRCRGCKRVRQLENLGRSWCAECVGAATLPERYAKLRARFHFADKGRRAFFDALDRVERDAGLSAHSSTRTRAMGHLLNAASPISSRPTWLDVHELRGTLSTLTPGTRHQASWALHRARERLLADGVLRQQPSKYHGSAAEQIEATLECFQTRDSNKRMLLRRLAHFYLDARPTITSVQVVQAFAYHLIRTTTPLTTWGALATAKHDVRARDGRWTRRILTALDRIGELLEAAGDLPRREDPDAVDIVVRRLTKVAGDRVLEINRRFVVDLERRGRRPPTLRLYVATLNEAWEWLAANDVTDPSQVTAGTWKKYATHLRRRRGANAIEYTRRRLRFYFLWLRRERIVLHVPIPGLPPATPVHVRVCNHQDFRALVFAIVQGQISSEPALLLYLVMFHAFRNFELSRVRPVGFVGEQFHLTVEPIPDVGDRPRSAGRPSPTIVIPTARYQWLRRIVDDALDARAKRIKDVSNPYLFVSGSWRNTRRPMNAVNFARTIRLVTERVCGRAISPTLLRVTAATLAADAGDVTVCRYLGWAAPYSLKFAYNPREIVAHMKQEELSQRKLRPPSYTPTFGMKRV
jgi:hypothetical protein